MYPNWCTRPLPPKILEGFGQARRLCPAPFGCQEATFHAHARHLHFFCIWMKFGAYGEHSIGALSRYFTYERASYRLILVNKPGAKKGLNKIVFLQVMELHSKTCKGQYQQRLVHSYGLVCCCFSLDFKYCFYALPTSLL
jgi:hypothetical protein